METLDPVYYAATFTSTDPDLRVIQISNMMELGNYAAQYFGSMDRLMMLSVPCHRGRTSEGVSFYQFYLADCHLKSPMNYHLQSFVEKAGLERVPFRCTKALVVAMAGDPFELRLTMMPDQYTMGTTGRVSVLDEMDIETFYPKTSIANLETHPIYTIPTACVDCFSKKIKCSKTFPCSNCTESGVQCCPATGMNSTMSRKVYNNWLKGMFHHNDSLKYFIYRQAIAVEGRSGVRNLDIRNLCIKLDASIRLNPYPEPLPSRDLVSLPISLKQFMQGCGCFKVEWLYKEDGYSAYNSPPYDMHFMGYMEALNLSREDKTPIMMCDTFGIEDAKTAINMLVESVESPEFPIVFYGKMMWRMGHGCYRVYHSTVKKMSVVLDCYHIITVTCIYRGHQSELGKLGRVI